MLETVAESGMMAKKLKTEVKIELRLNAAAARPSGKKTKSTFMLMGCSAALAN
jgi:hypothetical protein